ncbi:hypothetical protein ACVWXN_000259 [Bradyrhizobium sp. i1.4.4]
MDKTTACENVLIEIPARSRTKSPGIKRIAGQTYGHDLLTAVFQGAGGTRDATAQQEQGYGSFAFFDYDFALCEISQLRNREQRLLLRDRQSHSTPQSGQQGS